MKIINKENIILKNENLTLRLLQKCDLETVRQWRNQDDIRQCFFDNRIITEKQQLLWWESYKIKDDDFVFMIISNGEEKPVGMLSLYNVTNVSAEFGRLMIGEEWARGCGYAKEAMEMILRFGFLELLLESVYLEVLTQNVRAVNLYLSKGFTVEKNSDGIICMRLSKKVFECA